MTNLQVGDRVRVGAGSFRSYGGRSGEVVPVSYTKDGAVSSYLVRLNRMSGGGPAVCLVCSPRELEPVQGGDE